MSEVFSADTSIKAIDVRESMRVCPQQLQRGLTAITGKALSGEKPWPKGPLYHVMTAVTVFMLGIVSSACASYFLLSMLWGRQWLPLMQWPLILLGLLLGWSLTVSGARKLQVMIVHQAAHDNLFGIPWLDTWIGVVLSIILTIGSFASYRLAHRRDHHARLMTADDPTLRFLEDLVGLRQSMPKPQCWQQLYRALWSPTFHARFFWSRLCSHFRGASPDHILATSAFLALMVGAVIMTRAWGIFLLAWVLPLTVF